MSDSISFKGSTIFNSASSGIGYQFTPGSLVRNVVEAGAPQGIGYWIKQGNKQPAVHVLSLQWFLAGADDMQATIDALADGTVGTLTVPGFSFAKCLLTNIGAWSYAPTDSGYTVSTTLTFRQYP